MKVSNIIAAQEEYMRENITQWRKCVDAGLNAWSNSACRLTTLIVYSVNNAEERTLLKTWITEYLNDMRDAKGEILVIYYPAYEWRDSEGSQRITISLKVY